MLEYYRNHHFVLKDGKLDETWVGIIFSQMIKKLYNITLDTKIIYPIELPNNGFIFPTFYFEQEIQGKLNFANHLCTGSWTGNKYNDEKYLADCYNSCRKNLNETKALASNQEKAKKKFFKNYFQLLLLNLFLVIIDIIVKIYYSSLKRYLTNKQNYS